MGVVLGVSALWLAQHNLSRFGFRDWFFWLPIAVLLTTIAALSAWFALRGDRPESRDAMRASWRGGLLVGGVGLVIGYIGPLIIWPDSNVGPLIGILLLGPVGFPLGALGALGVRLLRAFRSGPCLT